MPDTTDDSRAEVRRLRHLLAQCGYDRQKYYDALVNIIALDAIPRADLGDAVGYAQEAIGETDAR